VRRGIKNEVNPVIQNNLTIVAANMESVRELLDCNPIIISSGFRNMEVNRIIGGSTKSAHMLGWAVDFICPRFGTPKQIVDKLKDSDIKFDQVIEEGTWVHISFAPERRRQILKATFKNGKATYTIY
jgi:putative chitinase